MLEYYKLFVDYEQLRAYISDISTNLDQETELDIFIRNAKYNTYLNRVTRDEHRLSSMRHKYRGSQIVETLEKFLLAPDSPALRDTSNKSKHVSSTQDKKVGSKFIRKFAKAKINLLECVSESDDDDPDDDHGNDEEEEIVTLDNDELIAELNAIKVPKSNQAREVFHIYCASVHRINAQPAMASDPECIVCGGKHRFDKCKILANQDFLCGHYVRYCSQLKKDKLAKEKIKANAANTPKASVNFVQADEGEDNSSDEEDFQRGRV